MLRMDRLVFFAGSGNLGIWKSRNHLDTKALLKPGNGFRNPRASGRLTLGRNRTTVRRESAVGAPLPAPTTGPVFPTFRLKIRTRCDASPPGVPPTIQPGEECPQDASLGSHPPSSAPHPSPPGKTSADHSPHVPILGQRHVSPFARQALPATLPGPCRSHPPGIEREDRPAPLSPKKRKRSWNSFSSSPS